MPCVNAKTMVGERAPAGTGETSVATQENKTTPPSEKTIIGLWALVRATTAKPVRPDAATGIADVTAAPLPQSNECPKPRGRTARGALSRQPIAVRRGKEYVIVTFGL
jgi:septal ring-binding cell division protein DamX